MPAAISAPVRQLDIIADTALANDLRTPKPSGSSSVQIIIRRTIKHSGSSSVATAAEKTQKHSGSSNVDQRIVAIDRRRCAAAISHSALCRLAGVEVNNWHRLMRGEHAPSDATIKKLNDALDAPRNAKPPQIIAGFHRLVMQQLALHLGFDVATLFATDFRMQRPSNQQWLQAARIRQMATYITAVELEVENVELARALGETRENVRYARNQVENRRDDGNEVDLALIAVTQQVRA